MIQDKDISIVVQGPILTHAKYNTTNHMTQLACQRLRQLFPESELILSTWEGENVQNIAFDKVIFNIDPGATWFHYQNRVHVNNCNRLIVSTQAGIRAATRKYVLKVRSDLFLVSKNFLKYFNHYPLYNEEYKFVKSRILAFSMWSIQGHKTSVFTMQKPFHVSDWTYFGFREDLLNLYSLPLVEEPGFSQWFLNRCKPFFDIDPLLLWKMPPEQYILSSFFSQYYAIKLEHTADATNHNMEKSAQMIMNNFLILDQSQYFFISLKHFCFQFSRHNHEWFIYHSTWLKNYLRFIPTHSLKNSLKINLIIILRSTFGFAFYQFLRILNKKEHIAKFTSFLIKKSSEKSVFKLLDRPTEEN